MTIQINVFSRRWFQKLYGNTYHVVSVEVFLEGSNKPYLIIDSEITYGYGNHYQQTANAIIERLNLGNDISVRFFDPIDVKRKKDLKDFK